MTACPDRVKQALLREFFDAFGFPPASITGDDDESDAPFCRLHICTLRIDVAQAEILTKDMQMHWNTVGIRVSTTWKRWVQVDWSLYEEIPRIIQYLLDRGYRLTLLSTLANTYEPGDVFDAKALEKLFVERVRRRYASVRDWYLLHGTASVLCKSNWKTEEGQEFCQDLQIALNRKEASRPPTDLTNALREIGINNWRDIEVE